MYDVGGQEGIWWVKANALRGAHAGEAYHHFTAIYMAYGDGADGWATTDQDDIAAVWENHYISVFHFNEDHEFGEYFDSCLVSDIDTNVNVTPDTGYVDKGMKFGGNAELRAPHDERHWVEDNLTLTTKLKMPGGWGYICEKYEHGVPLRGYMFWIEVAGTVSLYIGSPASAKYSSGVTAIDDNVWHTLGATYDGAEIQSFVDGATDGPAEACTLDPYETVQPLAWGREIEGPSSPLPNNTFIDEFRLHNTVRTVGWLKTEHYSMEKTNYHGDDKFLFYGLEQDNATTIELTLAVDNQMKTDEPMWLELDSLSINVVSHSRLPDIVHTYAAGGNGDCVHIQRELWWANDVTDMWEQVGLHGWTPSDATTYQMDLGVITLDGNYKLVVKCEDGDSPREAIENAAIYSEDELEFEIIFDDTEDLIVDTGELAIVRYEEWYDIDYMVWSGDWTMMTEQANHSQRGYAYADDEDAFVAFTFQGNTIKWIGAKATSSGIAEVFIDGVSMGTIDLYNAGGNLYQVDLFEQAGLSESNADGSLATHVIKIVATGTKHASSSGTNIYIDAFDVTGHNIPFPVAFEEEAEMDLLDDDAFDFYRDGDEE